MAKKRRAGKSVLGQTVKSEKPKEELKVEVVETPEVTPEVADGDGSILELTISDGKQSQILHSTDHLKERLEKVEVEREKTEEPEQPEQPIDADERVEEEAPVVRKVSDLNASEYRYYLNTGKIPQ